jgi:hypothetical protein
VVVSSVVVPSVVAAEVVVAEVVVVVVVVGSVADVVEAAEVVAAEVVVVTIGAVVVVLVVLVVVPAVVPAAVAFTNSQMNVSVAVPKVPDVEKFPMSFLYLRKLAESEKLVDGQTLFSSGFFSGVKTDQLPSAACLPLIHTSRSVLTPSFLLQAFMKAAFSSAVVMAKSDMLALVHESSAPVYGMGETIQHIDLRYLLAASKRSVE